MSPLMQRLAAAYCEAQDAQRNTRGGRVHVEIGAGIYDALKAMATHPTAPGTETLWGFPMVLAEGDLDLIRVHAVTTIH